MPKSKTGADWRACKELMPTGECGSLDTCCASANEPGRARCKAHCDPEHGEPRYEDACVGVPGRS